MNVKEKIGQVLGSLLLVFMAGSVGYYTIYGGEHRFIDCMYMTVISLTSVGYGEVLQVTGNVGAQVFTMLLLVFGMGIILYGISMLAALMIEGELSGVLRERKMQKRIERLKNHYIICGGGETGRPLIDELLKNRQKVVLIENHEESIALCRSMEGLLYIVGDATDDQNLIKAGIDRAAGIIVCLPSDKDTLYVTMTARMLNTETRIISRMVDPKLEPKLRKAGADRVVSPNHIGALRMASEIIRPTVVDFLDSMLRSRQGTLRINQISILEDSELVGKKISESGLKSRFDLLVLGSKREGREIEFNPPATLGLEPGMSLIVMGEVEKIEAARSVLCPHIGHCVSDDNPG